MDAIKWEQIEKEFIEWDKKGRFIASQRQILNWFKNKLSQTESIPNIPTAEEIKEHNPYPHPVSDAQLWKGVGFIKGGYWVIEEIERRNKQC